MNLEDYHIPERKFYTRCRDTMYHQIRENDNTGIFGQVSSVFLMAFAIGYHRDVRKGAKGKGSINHVNMTSIDIDIQDLLILMILERHAEITSPEQKSEVWDLIEQYAEGGIGILYESLRLSEWVLDPASIIGD